MGVSLLSSRTASNNISVEKAADLGSEGSDQSESRSTAQCINQIYCKSLRLTSEQIVRASVHGCARAAALRDPAVFDVITVIYVPQQTGETEPA